MSFERITPHLSSDTVDSVETAILKAEHDQVKRAGRLHWVHWFIVGASFLLTLGAWYLVKSQEDEKRTLRFEKEAEQVVGLVSERMQKYEDALWAGVAAIRSQSHGIDYREWKLYSESLKIDVKYPGINGIGVIYHVPPADISAFLARERIARPDFNVHPAHDRGEFWPITYIEPVRANAAAVGLDMAHEANRHTAAKKARDTGKAQITGPIVLVQDAERTPGFLFYAPFYRGGTRHTVDERRENFVGLVYAPFIFKKLMEGVLAKENRRVGIRISDGADVLYDENIAEVAGFDPRPLFRKTIQVHEYGRVWDFQISSKLSFRHDETSRQPWLILAGGIVIDSLLLGLFVVLARSNRRALSFADRMSNQYQAQANRLSNIIENAVDGLVTVTEEGLVDSFNPACERIFGYRAEEAIGLHISRLIAGSEVEVEDEDGDGDKEIQNIGELLFLTSAIGVTRSGDRFPIDLSFSEITIDGRHLFSGIVRDITERDKAEKEILRSNLELERFAYVASHDLQEPLRMVSNFTELLRREYGDGLDSTAQKYIDYTCQASGRMQALVSDLLDYSRADSDSTGFEEFDSGEAVAVVLRGFEEQFEESGADVKVGALPVIFAGKMRFSRLLQNLVGNAVKYRDPGRRLSIQIDAKDQGSEWWFSIRDTGIGIMPQYLNQIFVLFKRLHRKDEITGTGMGLAICVKIVESFGGRIWAESEFGSGSVFYFSIPKSATQRGAR